MEFLIWGGAALTLGGVGGLVWCILLALKARKAGGSDAEIKARLQRIVAINLAALAVSALGLMAVVLGVMLA
jgi:hypothetical protein